MKNKRTNITIKLSPELKESFQSAIDKNNDNPLTDDVNISSVIREAIIKFIKKSKWKIRRLSD